MAAVLIRGEGIAGTRCSRLLGDAGLQLTVEKLRRSKLPAVMLGDTAQKLLRDVFNRADLFEGLPQIRRRVVAWGRDYKPLTLPHSAVVVSEQELLDRIRQPLPQSEQPEAAEPEWTIVASPPLGPSSVEHHFGSRIAAASPVRLEPGCDVETCWIESLESGWLFLLPGGEGTASEIWLATQYGVPIIAYGAHEHVATGVPHARSIEEVGSFLADKVSGL